MILVVCTFVALIIPLKSFGYSNRIVSVIFCISSFTALDCVKVGFYCFSWSGKSLRPASVFLVRLFGKLPGCVS